MKIDTKWFKFSFEVREPGTLEEETTFSFYIHPSILIIFALMVIAGCTILSAAWGRP